MLELFRTSQAVATANPGGGVAGDCIAQEVRAVVAKSAQVRTSVLRGTGEHLLSGIELPEATVHVVFPRAR